MDIMQNVVPTYVFTWKKRRYSWIEYLLISTLFLSMLAVVFWLVYWDLLKLADIKKLASSPSFPWFHFFLFFLILASNFAILKFNRSARLCIDSSGVRLKLLPESGWTILRFLEKELLWADLKDVKYMKRLQLIQLRSRLSGRHMGHMTIRLNDWQMQTTTHGSQANDAEPDLIKVLREFDIFEKYPSNSQSETSSFDLTKNAATKNLLLVLSCLVVYCFVDVMSQHEGYAFFNLEYCLPHIISGLSVTLILVYCLLKARSRDFIPSGIVGVLAVMGGITFGTASYVAGIRINQFVGGPLLEARYHRDAGCENLLPEDTSLPVVEYTHMTRDYWCSKTADEVLTIKVRKGLFGLYQFDLREHTQAIRDYRQKH
ncbi:hypothetical protein [Undibacterium pigrum]|uniref:Uncharacterized protein n=1 Tax=Undibacterium pigrum TaxID=401470 RepID=A0A318J4T3_9BURK|nr:hypothetical protein [Undibacterium pigrum]PXX43792.1 hypothetical protein DFR42_10360 [Undibacterium pigrum]